MNSKTSKLTALLGSASLMTLSHAVQAQAQQVAQAQMAQAAPMEVPEQVLITGSLIRGTAAVGVPVTNLSPQDFAQTGALTTGDLFRSVPAANVIPGPIALQSGANIERATRVNIRGLDTGDFTRSLLMVDGIRVPPQGNGVCEIDPGIIPALSQDRIDILVDGASATYGSDAVSGVINIILKRAFDGAVTQLHYTTGHGGKQTYLASQLWGRTWDGGDITLSYEWYDNIPTVNKGISKMTLDFRPWGLEDRTPLASALPGIISTGQAVQSATLGLGTTATSGTNCTNCFSIPAGAGTSFNPINGGIGPTAPFSASTLNWGTFSPVNGGTNGSRNEYNPYLLSWYDAAQQRNGGALTFDQRLTRSITAYGEGFYSNRRAEYINPPVLSPSSTNLLRVAVPTWNPYYPTGGAPNNLRVNYSLETELPSYTDAYELADRYMAGLNFDLPGGWSAQAYFSSTYDSSFNHVTNTVNVNAVSAALGWTILPTVGVGTSPGITSWTKPSTVPYLNLFCDPRVNQCNSPTTLNYMTGIRQFNEKFTINEKGVKADGPLFAVPAGDVKAAIGATYTTQAFSFNTFDNTGAPNLLAPSLVDSQHRSIWAVFTQVNVPVIGDANALPGIRKLDFEGSWRHDQYNDVGGTSNPKVAFNWSVSEDLGLTVRGAWGTSFNAPGWGILSPLANNAIAGQNIPTIFGAGQAPIVITCTPGAGSGADRLLHPVVGPALPCGTAVTPGATPGGISQLGSSVPPTRAGWRNLVNTEGQVLHPEQAMNWGIGGEFAPITFLRGLDLQATWYSVKITGVLRTFGNPTTSAFNDASRGFSYIIPTDLFGIDPACNNNLTPTTCPEFENMVLGILSDSRNPVPSAALTNVNWLNDGGAFNKGWQKTTGIDWTASYDFDTGDLGAWNVGITGTYYLHWYSKTVDSDVVTDLFHSTINALNGVPQEGVTLTGGIGAYRMRYRARLGWSNGPWSLTGFMDYVSHYFSTQSAPPNVNFGCTAIGGNIGGGTFPCAISNYSNIQPGMYTFDLSGGYDTGDTPENDYLKHIGIQLIVQNITNKMPAFQYRISTGGGNPAAMDILKSAQGRTISLIVTKTW
jgi:outer membrane receptor protein involved in Fe transport